MVNVQINDEKPPNSQRHHLPTIFPLVYQNTRHLFWPSSSVLVSLVVRSSSPSPGVCERSESHSSQRTNPSWPPRHQGRWRHRHTHTHKVRKLLYAVKLLCAMYTINTLKNEHH